MHAQSFSVVTCPNELLNSRSELLLARAIKLGRSRLWGLLSAWCLQLYLVSYKLHPEPGKERSTSFTYAPPTLILALFHAISVYCRVFSLFEESSQWAICRTVSSFLGAPLFQAVCVSEVTWLMKFCIAMNQLAWLRRPCFLLRALESGLEKCNANARTRRVDGLPATAIPSYNLERGYYMQLYCCRG